MRLAVALVLIGLLAIACASEPPAPDVAGQAADDPVLESFDESLQEAEYADPYGDLEMLEEDLVFE